MFTKNSHTYFVNYLVTHVYPLNIYTEGVRSANLGLCTERWWGDGLSSVCPRVKKPIYADYLYFWQSEACEE